MTSKYNKKSSEVIQLNEDLQRYIIELTQQSSSKRFYTYYDNFLSVYMDLSKSFNGEDIFFRVLCKDSESIVVSNVFYLFNIYEEDEYHSMKVQLINTITHKIKSMHYDDNVPITLVNKILKKFADVLQDTTEFTLQSTLTRTSPPRQKASIKPASPIIDESFLKKLYVNASIIPKTFKLHKFYDVINYGETKSFYITINEYTGIYYANVVCVYTEGTMKRPQNLVISNISDIETKKKIFVKIVQNLSAKFEREGLKPLSDYAHYIYTLLKIFNANTHHKLSTTEMNELIKIARQKLKDIKK
jgi:hypothetical protein